jgi:hypothetical protein
LRAVTFAGAAARKDAGASRLAKGLAKAGIQQTERGGGEKHDLLAFRRFASLAFLFVAKILRRLVFGNKAVACGFQQQAGFAQRQSHDVGEGCA